MKRLVLVGIALVMSSLALTAPASARLGIPSTVLSVQDDATVLVRGGHGHGHGHMRRGGRGHHHGWSRGRGHHYGWSRGRSHHPHYGMRHHGRRF